MSVLENMLASERIPDAFENWKEYREQVTAFIVRNCPAETGERPTLAVWGAGRANDIDLAKLHRTYELVLIDRDLEAVKEGLLTYGLSESDAAAADLPFWRVDTETYEMFEALLADGAETEPLLELLSQTAWTNGCGVRPEFAEQFDYSVCIGLHSQLNARFAGLLYAYRKQYDTEDLKLLTQAVQSLNKAAVTRTNDVVYALTKRNVVYGYEIMSCLTRRHPEESLRAWEKRILEHADGADEEEIDGVRELRQDICLHKDADMRLLEQMRLFWPFDGGQKAYLMELAATAALTDAVSG